MDRTREDISQDARIARLEQDVKDLLEASSLSRRLYQRHEDKLRELAPLTGLIEFVETIKSHFANFRLK